MQFGWINFYSEFASKLLLFKNDRKTLISNVCLTAMNNVETPRKY